MMFIGFSRRVLPALWIGVILAGCSSQAAVPPATSIAQAPTSAPAATVPPATTPTSAPTTTPTLTPTSAPTATPAPTAQPTADPITGAPAYARGQITTRPYLVMIDNHPDAYPQTGLNQAAVVVEALAEYGVTRFMALYPPGISPQLAKIGPVRSTRLYFAQWAMGFHALYIHAGGSPSGLQLAQTTTELVNLDLLPKATRGYGYRASNRDAPHNLYTSTDQLAEAATALDPGTFAGDEQGFLFKNDPPLTQRPDSQTASYFFLYSNDPAGWQYNAETNGYLRTRRGRAARDADSGERIWTKNVVVMEVHEQKIAGDEKGRIEQDVIGEGPARFLVDGTEQQGVWRKASAEAPLRFYGEDDAEVQFNAGPIWIAAVPDLANLVVK